jgi:hypothetical protein
MIHTPVIDTQRLSTLAHDYSREMLRFLEDHHGLAVPRIHQEMDTAGFDEVRIDPAGTVLGRIGTGKPVIMMKSHAAVGGAGLACLVYAGKLIHELGMYAGFTLWVVGAGRKEAFDGLRPDCVLAAEPTGLRIYRPLTVKESHPLVQSAIATYEALFELPPVIGRWPGAFFGVPTIRFGPGEEGGIDHLIKAVQFYAAFPQIYVDTMTRR